MAREDSNMSKDSKPAKSGKSHSALKTAGVLAVLGAATYAVAKGLKTPKGRALKKKAMTKGRKVVRQVKSTARGSAKRGARKTASRAR
jgi:hypothetical protein